MNRRRSELTVTERVAFISWRLMAGDVWTTSEVAALMGLDWSATYRRLEMMSRILPIYQDDQKRWRRVVETDEN